MESIQTRCSIRKYKNQKIEKEKINKILRAGFCAPSAMNQQPWELIVIEKKETLVQLSKIASSAIPLSTATLGIVVCANLLCNHSVDFCQQDLAAATENMLVEANYLGIDSCWLGAYPNLKKVNKIKKMFDIPESVLPLWMISFGYADEMKEIKDKWNRNKIHYEMY